VRRRLGRTYGRRVVVVAGPGHNGDDGRVAAALLQRWGVRVVIVDAGGRDGPPPVVPACDLVVDAAYGTGFRGAYRAPEVPPGAQVVAVDIPSGVHGDSGEAAAGAVRASATVTFAALKPGLLVGAGPERAGRVEVVDIGLDVSRARSHVVEDADMALLPGRPREAHKWQSALYVVAGSPGMMGSAWLCSRAAMRAGAGMVRLGVPGAGRSDLPVGEVVARGLPREGWEDEVLEELGRCRALAVGPGLGPSEASVAAVRRLVCRAPVPVLLDADGLNVLGPAENVAGLVAKREAAGCRAPMVLTPHDGEYARLMGVAPGPDRFEAARALAHRSAATVVLKGSTTVVASPDGRTLAAVAGSPRLATAGTGDVLSGIVGAFLARGLDGLVAGALGAHAHGRAAALGPARGLVAGDLVALLPRYLSDVAVASPT
ncbi:MAG: NAD(P)H-hydrate dehydratase, partial [Acidimicrobiales bacterium]